MLEPSIVDTHVHLWDLDRLPYPWLQDLPLLHETHGLDDYDEAIGEARVKHFVFVECTESLDDETSRDEVRWVSSLAQQDDRLQGIVAHASLEEGREARDHLEWLAQRPLVKGVRRLLQDEPDRFFRRSSFVEGLQMLPAFNLSFDVTVRAPQLPDVIDLVDQCPDVRFVLDHIGKPNIREGRLDPWREHLASLAERSNVVCKLSGVLTEADLEGWTPDGVRPYLEHALECFGVDRVMFGGDWPVLRLAADYPTWLDVLEPVLQDYSEAERGEILSSNAKRMYGLG